MKAIKNIVFVLPEFNFSEKKYNNPILMAANEGALHNEAKATEKPQKIAKERLFLFRLHRKKNMLRVKKNQEAIS